MLFPPLGLEATTIAPFWYLNWSTGLHIWSIRPEKGPFPCIPLLARPITVNTKQTSQSNYQDFYAASGWKHEQWRKLELPCPDSSSFLLRYIWNQGEVIREMKDAEVAKDTSRTNCSKKEHFLYLQVTFYMSNA